VTFQPQVIRDLIVDDPAIEKHNELRVIKARERKIRSASDFIKDEGLE